MSTKKENPLQDKPLIAENNTLPAWLQSYRNVGIAIAVFAFLLYANTLFFGFAQDDAIVITDNIYTQKGFSGIPDLLKYDTFKGFFKEEGKEKLVQGGRYRPLTPIIFAIEYEIFGKSAFMGHLTNVLIFSLSCMLLYFCLIRLLAFKFPNHYTIIALITSLIFAAHPIHTEAVANIKGLDEVLTLAGCIGALYLSVLAWQEKKRILYLLSGLVFFLSLFSKENAITYVAVVPLAFYCFTFASIREILGISIPYVAAAVLFVLVRHLVIGTDIGSAPPRELMNNPFLKWNGSSYIDLTSSEKYGTIFHTLGQYIRLLFFPVTLTHDYYPRHIRIMQMHDASALFSMLGYIIIAAGAIILTLRRNPWGFVLGYFLVTISIVSNLLFPIGTNMGERFAYMPSLAFCLGIAIVFSKLFSKKPNLVLSLALAGLVVAAFSVKTLARTPAWKDDFTLFMTDITTSANSAKLNNAVGGSLSDKAYKTADSTEKIKLIREAIPHLNKAIEIHPLYRLAWLLKGNAHFHIHEYDSAIVSYQKALDMYPDYKEAKSNLGVAYRDAGRNYGERQGNLDKAIEYLDKARVLIPNDYEAWRLAGIAHGIKGDKEEAVTCFTKAAELMPTMADAWKNLSIAYNNLGDKAKAAEYLEKAKNVEAQNGAAKKEEPKEEAPPAPTK